MAWRPIGSVLRSCMAWRPIGIKAYWQLGVLIHGRNIQSKIRRWHRSVGEQIFTRLQRTVKYSGKYGMLINTVKTKTMVFSKRRMKHVGNTKLNNIAIEEVPNFVHLGSKLTWDNDSMEDIKRRSFNRSVQRLEDSVGKYKNTRLETTNSNMCVRRVAACSGNIKKVQIA